MSRAQRLALSSSCSSFVISLVRTLAIRMQSFSCAKGRTAQAAEVRSRADRNARDLGQLFGHTRRQGQATQQCAIRRNSDAWTPGDEPFRRERRHRRPSAGSKSANTSTARMRHGAASARKHADAASKRIVETSRQSEREAIGANTRCGSRRTPRSSSSAEQRRSNADLVVLVERDRHRAVAGQLLLQRGVHHKQLALCTESHESIEMSGEATHRVAQLGDTRGHSATTHSWNHQATSTRAHARATRRISKPAQRTTPGTTAQIKRAHRRRRRKCWRWACGAARAARAAGRPSSAP